MNLLKLRKHWGYSETNKNDWKRLCASFSSKTKTGHKISSRKSTLGETKLIFLIYRKDSKENRSISQQNKNNFVWFLGSVLFKKYYFAKQTQKKNAKCIIYYNYDKCFLVLVIYVFVMCYFFFHFYFESFSSHII